MAVPKRKTSTSKRNMRRSHNSLKAFGYMECPSCGEYKLPHHVCESCGTYRDRDVAKVASI